MDSMSKIPVIDVEHYLKKPWHIRLLIAFNAAWAPTFLIYYGMLLQDQVTRYDVGSAEFYSFLITAVCATAVLAMVVMYAYRQEGWINYWERNSWELLRDKDIMLRLVMAKDMELQLLRQKLAGLTSEQPSQERLN